jgi:hypothetical protein
MTNWWKWRGKKREKFALKFKFSEVVTWSKTSEFITLKTSEFITLKTSRARIQIVKNLSPYK